MHEIVWRDIDIAGPLNVRKACQYLAIGRFQLHVGDALSKAALTEHGAQLAGAPSVGVQSNGLDNRARWATETAETWPVAKAHWGLLRNHNTGSESFTGMQSRGMIRLYDANDNQELEPAAITPCRRAEFWRLMISNVQCLQVDVVELYKSDAAHEGVDSCDGGCRVEREGRREWRAE